MTPARRSDRVTLFVDHVTHIDCGILDNARGLCGATWLVDVALTGTRDAQGMLFDFGPAKKLLKAEIEDLVYATQMMNNVRKFFLGNLWARQLFPCFPDFPQNHLEPKFVDLMHNNKM